MMEHLARKLSSREKPFNPVDRHVMCFAHIVDLSTGRVIQEVEASNGKNKGGGDDAILSSPIALARSVVGAIRASGTRREAFEGVITDGNAKGWFMAGEPPEKVSLNNLQLLRDVPTRWDSVYHMIERLRVMRLVRLKFC